MRIILLGAVTSLALSLGNPALADSFGREGDDGRDGYDGIDGASGPDVTINLRDVLQGGEPLIYDLSGNDAGNGTESRDGESGRHGDDASQCSFPRSKPESDMKGAKGGDGGDAGDGGDGGDGGDLTIYFDQLSDLNTLTYIARGGHEGLAGERRGSPGQGCRCPKSSWYVRECRPSSVPNQPEICEEERYICTDGPEGGYGKRGRDGHAGSLGRLYLVALGGTQPEAEMPHASATVAQLTHEDIVLRHQVWVTEPGALALLAPGSVAKDEYAIFQDNVYQRFHLDWQVPDVPESELSRYRASFSVNRSGPNLSYVFHERTGYGSLIYKGSESFDPTQNLTTVRIDSVVDSTEFGNIKLHSVTGSGRNLRMILVDMGGRAAAFDDTSFEIDYQARDTVLYRSQFKGKLPRELVEQRGNYYVLRLGALPMRKERHKESGRNIRFTVKMTRRFADTTRSFDYDLPFEIP